MGLDADELLERLRREARCVAVAVRGHRDAECVDDVERLASKNHYFEIGSLTKPLTALLLARMVLAGELSLDMPIGAAIPVERNSNITLQELATHTSGLPRLPGNLMAKARETPEDPYGRYDADDLLAALDEDVAGSKAPEYSNYGYMVLALVLTKVAGCNYESLLRSHVLDPLGMIEATADPNSIPLEQRVQGFGPNDQPVPHWTKLLPGAGGVEASITSMAAFLHAQLDPASSPLEMAIEMTQRVFGDELLGWQRMGGLIWHNGGTGGFSSFLGFDRQAGSGVVILSNFGGGASTVDRAGLEALGVVNPLIG